MKIVLNNKEIFAEEYITVAGLLKHLGYKGWIVVILNGDKLLEKGYENTILKENDIVKIFKPLSGG